MSQHRADDAVAEAPRKYGWISTLVPDNYMEILDGSGNGEIIVALCNVWNKRVEFVEGDVVSFTVYPTNTDQAMSVHFFKRSECFTLSGFLWQIFPDQLVVHVSRASPSPPTNFVPFRDLKLDPRSLSVAPVPNSELWMLATIHPVLLFPEEHQVRRDDLSPWLVESVAMTEDQLQPKVRAHGRGKGPSNETPLQKTKRMPKMRQTNHKTPLQKTDKTFKARQTRLGYVSSIKKDDDTLLVTVQDNPKPITVPRSAWEPAKIYTMDDEVEIDFVGTLPMAIRYVRTPERRRFLVVVKSVNGWFSIAREYDNDTVVIYIPRSLCHGDDLISQEQCGELWQVIAVQPHPDLAPRPSPPADIEDCVGLWRARRAVSLKSGTPLVDMRLVSTSSRMPLTQADALTASTHSAALEVVPKDHERPPTADRPIPARRDALVDRQPQNGFGAGRTNGQPFRPIPRETAAYRDDGAVPQSSGRRMTANQRSQTQADVMENRWE